VYRKDFVDAALEAAPTTPGMKYRHYSPTAPVTLLDPSPSATLPAAVEANGGGSEGGQEADLAGRLRAAAYALVGELVAEAAHATLTAPASSHADSGRGGGLGELRAAGEGASGSGGVEGGAPRPRPPAARPRVGVLRTSLPAVPAGPLAGPAAAATPHQSPVAPPHAPADTAHEHAQADAGLAAWRDGRVLQFSLGHVSRPADVAAALFAGLRWLDAAGVTHIVVEGVADEGAGVAVMNRLRKAASRVVHV
jgi:hypothetical protein